MGVGLWNCFTYASPNASIWVTGNARTVSVFGFTENTPTVSATNSIVVDSGCSASLGDLSNVKPLSLAGYTNDTQGGTSPPASSTAPAPRTTTAMSPRPPPPPSPST
ncbi:hypothetical protein [Streptomyces sp. NPDC002573]|uniref:hypothetical protein n=1 Tax=Streptomyces sp. NPDC002573 TaxID=3364651 RepID=UPI0036B93075